MNIDNFSVDQNQIRDLINTSLNNSDVNKDVLFSQIIQYINAGNVIIYDDEKINRKLHDEHNRGRITKFTYVSLQQFKKNIKDNVLNTLISESIIGNVNTKYLGLTIISKIVASLFLCWHFVSKKERCIFIEAIKFYSDDPQRYHSVQDFIPKLLDGNACDNRELNCHFQVGERCNIKEADIAATLLSLSKKYILDRNDRNEYRYCRW